MKNRRIATHPIVEKKGKELHSFFFEDQKIAFEEGETIMTALIAQGIDIFGSHHKDNHPLGIFCANGQCSQCTVLADDKPVKSCMTLARDGMKVRPCHGLPTLPPKDDKALDFKKAPIIEKRVLIIGAGPSGLGAARELGEANIGVLMVDDRPAAGGKLLLQTHKFFGSIQDCMAGERGINIAQKLWQQVKALETVEFIPQATVIGIYSDGLVGLYIKEPWQNGPNHQPLSGFVLIKPELIIIATGAREKSLAISGGTLPGVFGAGAFQTLVNRDQVLCSERVFIIGGGNVGLIAGYHAIQGGIKVAGLIEAMPQCGGYKVHHDKLARLGVPIYTSHVAKRIIGLKRVEGIEIVQVDSDFNQLPNSEKLFAVDTVLIAVGLQPVDEFIYQAKTANLRHIVVGDCKEIAEASAAIFSGRIGGRQAVIELTGQGEIPAQWQEKADLLKSRPGRTILPESDQTDEKKGGIGKYYPVIHCFQEIPCNPCSTVCPNNSIKIEGGLMGLPTFAGKCDGCLKCLAICPGLAITLVRENQDGCEITFAVEQNISFERNSRIMLCDRDGKNIGPATVIRVVKPGSFNKTQALTVSCAKEFAPIAASIALFKSPLDEMVQSPYKLEENKKELQHLLDQELEDPIICRCERIRKSTIDNLIAQGIRDLNQIKGITRAGMGACGGKTCQPLIVAAMRQAGIPLEEILKNTSRPLFTELTLGILAGEKDE